VHSNNIELQNGGPCEYISYHEVYHFVTAVVTRVICALFFSSLAAEKSGPVKYADFFVEVLLLVLFQYNLEYGKFYQYFIVIL
jgi:hypothetical protein